MTTNGHEVAKARTLWSKKRLKSWNISC